MKPAAQMERLFALEVLNRLERHIQELLPRLSFAGVQELRKDADDLMHAYRIVKKPEGYQLRELTF